MQLIITCNENRVKKAKKYYIKYKKHEIDIVESEISLTNFINKN